MLNTARLFDFLKQKADGGQQTALVTVTRVTGASVRNPGAHMAVSEDGSSAGSLSGGCIEAAVVSEAILAIRAGKPREITYGAGSPIIDIRLPCGGSVELLFNPIAEPDWAAGVAAHIRDRNPAHIQLPRNHGHPSRSDDTERGWQGDAFHVYHVPPLRIIILGHGGSVEALVAQARSIEAEIEVLTPDPVIHDRLMSKAVNTQLLSLTGEVMKVLGDPWTAFVFYFHDHDWEGSMLAQALRGPSLYVGAMGSHKTHAARVEGLKARGITDDVIAKIRAPIGLIPSSRDPETLALSTLAEIVQAYNAVVSPAGPQGG
jgi:xanthine dehydrogenase accessory factor